jgi:multiple sugar transport system permease protein
MERTKASMAIDGLSARTAIRAGGARRKRTGGATGAARKTGLYIALTVCTLIALGPLIWMLLASFMPLSQTTAYPPKLWPHPFTLAGYRAVFGNYPFLDFLRNSLIIAVISTIGSLASCSAAAFALSRLRFKGRSLLFMAVITSLIVPFAARMIPIFIEMRSVHWLNTWLPIILPNILGNAYGIFLLRQFFITVPRELNEAAMLDGCNAFGILWRIYIPVSKPALAALSVITFVMSWNDFITPLVFINNPTLMPVAVGIAQLKGEATASWSWLMAAATLSVLPLVLLYAIAHKQVVTGMTLSRSK